MYSHSIANIDTHNVHSHSTANIVQLLTYLQDLFDRDHKELLIDYMRYMVHVINRGAMVEPNETAKTVYSEEQQQSMSSRGTSSRGTILIL